MKKIFFLLTAAIALILSGCDSLYTDEFAELHEEIDELRAMISETNSNVAALQAIVNAIQGNDFVTGVTPITENGVQIGYTITFSKSGTVTIYHGNDGKDGHTPVIGVRQYDDGEWYWTIDGEWLTNEHGDMVRASGKDGQQGQPGEQGITPQLKIEDGDWYASFDYGESWSYIGRATGEDGNTPVIGIRQYDDGEWYWTIDGEWLTDEYGDMIRASGKDGQQGQPGEQGITPQLKIEDGDWYVSFDNGESWNYIGRATGEDGDSMFQEIRVADTEIVFVMADGSEFMVPRKPDVKIHFDIPEGETGILPGREIQIYYTLENATEDTFVTASSNGHYTVKVESWSPWDGRILIKCPHTYEDGYVNIMVSDGRSFSFVKVINLFEYYMEFSEGLEYYPGNHGGVIEIPFWTNFPYIFEVEYDAQSWLSVETIETRAEMKYGTLLVKVKENNEDNARVGRIFVIPTNSTGETYTEIIINQSSSTFRIDQSKFAIPAEGKTVETNIVSSRGLSIEIPEEAKDWISAVVEETGTDQYKVIATVQEHTGTQKRAASIKLHSGDGATYLGSIEFVQSSPNEEDLEDMIFIVRANYSNEFTAHLPICGEYDCYIDWGDGQAEYAKGEDWENKGISHKYKTSEPTSYTVRISNRVTRLNSENLPAPCIVEVVQWGMTGLNDLNSAFENNYMLKKVAEDTYGAFSGVYSIDQMFCKCIELESVPERLFDYCRNISYMYETFAYCKKLHDIPSGLFARMENLDNMDAVFRNCDSLTDIPQDLFVFNTRLKHMNWVFHDCNNLVDIPATLFRNNYHIESFYGTFDNCDNLKHIPGSLFSTNSNARLFESTFCNCYSLENIPAELFRKNRNANNFNATFANCHQLKEIPTDLFDDNRKVIYFRDTFSSCHGVEGESPYTIIGEVKYHLYERHLNPDHFAIPIEYYACFGGCERLIDYHTEIVPARWGW